MTRRAVLSTAPGSRPEAFALLDWGLLAAVAGMWGSSFLFISEGVESFAPPVITLGRLVLGAATLAVAGRRAPLRRIEAEDRAQIVLLAALWMVIPFLLFPIAQQWVDSSIAGMINGSTPLFAAVVAAILLRRWPGPFQVAGLLVGFAGVLAVTLPVALDADGSPLGIGLLVVAAAMYGVALNMTVPLQQRYGALPVLLRAQAAAIVMALPFGIAGLFSSEWSWPAAGSVVFLGVFSTGFAFVAALTLTGRSGATRGSLPVYFVPIVAMILGVLVRGESIPPIAVAGMVLVIAGAWLISRRER